MNIYNQTIIGIEVTRTKELYRGPKNYNLGKTKKVFQERKSWGLIKTKKNTGLLKSHGENWDRL